LRSLQARGNPQEAAREVRALLDLVRDNEAAEHKVFGIRLVLLDASLHLKILDPEHGEEELIKAVEAAQAKLDPLSPFESENESESESENESKSESENESESESDGEGGLYSRTVSPCESDA
jgi:hypothetical protein